MEKNTCKLCFRSFANGRALGGHMRSHVTATAKAAATAAEAQFSPSPIRWTSSDEYDEEEEEGYGLRENPKKSVRLLYPEFSSVVQDRESEAESSRATATHRLRSKRPRPPAYAATPEPEPVSSVSNATAEEDVAISLMLLSRDTWKNDDDEEEEEEEVGLKKKQQQVAKMKGRCKYQCGTCKKVFRSYQALGGHRASHKKFKSCVAPPPLPPPPHSAPPAVQIHEAAVHECPVCLRVFASGQALGGHKRSHLTPSTTITSSSSIVPPPPPPPPPAAAAAAAQNVLIDLNLPAPMEEDTDQLSAVSDELNWGVGIKR